ncbi:MAG: hypothetical protein RDU13_11085, partial [Elusimicrobiales bacterium]|nr:hypothetical protein [Elusimicrobiales bacterium]
MVLEDMLVVRGGQGLVLFAHESKPVYYVPDLRHRIIAGGVEVEDLFNERRFCRVRQNGPQVLVVQVAERSPARPYAVAELLAYASLDVLREVVHIILALAEGYGQHELALWRGVEPEGGELKGGYLAGVLTLPQYLAQGQLPFRASS